MGAEVLVEEVKKEVQKEAPEDEGTSEAAKAEVADEAEVGAEVLVEEVKKEVQKEAPEDEGSPKQQRLRLQTRLRWMLKPQLRR